MELAIGRELFALGLIVLALMAVMWALARTRRLEG